MCPCETGAPADVPEVKSESYPGLVEREKGEWFTGEDFKGEGAVSPRDFSNLVR